MTLLQDYKPLFNYTEKSPHNILGLQDKQVIRLWRPVATQVSLVVKGKNVNAELLDPCGLFEYYSKEALSHLDYQIYHQSGLLAHDPYAFDLTLSDLDQYLYAKGEHYELYKIMGGRLTEIDGVKGVRFVVWAPSATRISVVGAFNHWDGRVNPMTLRGRSGVWELFIPGLKEGDPYKYEIRTMSGSILLKADPFALTSEVRPKNASVVGDYTKFQWTDSEWMEKKKNLSFESSPMSVYEVHLGSWKQDNGNFINYRKLAPMLAEYVAEMGFTHVELLPISEYPLDESWGYQVTGYFAPTSRFGSIEDFQFFINYLHEKGIGVILDWVPGHFPVDNFSLSLFDGTPLYEHEDPKQGFHPHWYTLIFEFGHPKVANFLIASALFWLKEMHLDGLRVDAVASMLYLDYGRHYGEWNPNRFGGKEYIEAIEFFQHLNQVIQQKVPEALLIAEESTSFPGITTKVKDGGLGFHLKWNMGWMNDTLRFFSLPMEKRSADHRDLTFSMVYYYTEKFVSALSHDEVVHEKKSLLAKMPGNMQEKFANLRLLYSYMICHTGKQLIFMGGEFGQWNEWNCKKELDWQLLDLDIHKSYHRMVKEFNHFYLDEPALWEKDFERSGFQWVDHSDHTNSIISYLRMGKKSMLLCVHNFLNRYHPSYFLKLPGLKSASQVFNTDSKDYGGSGVHCHTPVVIKGENGQSQGVTISLPPLSTVIFKVEA